MPVFVAIVAGLVLGSFLSVLLSRWPSNEGVVTGRSRCPHCSHVLAWYDLVPLVSWLLLRGKCRYCGVPIPKLYPALELVMASALGGYVAVQGFLWPRDGFLLPAIALLVMHFFFDLKMQILPDSLTALLTVVALGRLAVVHPFPLMNGLAAGLFAVAAVLLIYVLTKGNGIGFGDVKLAFPLGLLFGSPRLLGVVLTSVWAGALFGVGLMLLRRATMKTALPFGSFWTAAAVIALIWPAAADWPFRLLMP